MMFEQSTTQSYGNDDALDATLLVDCGNALGEGVQWHPRQRRLFWTDIEGRMLWSCDEAGGRIRRVPLDERLCSFAFSGDGRILGAFADGLAWLDPRSGARRLFEPYMADATGVRMNDGAVDRQGRFIVGGYAETPDAPGTQVWSVDRGRIRVLLDGVRTANSIAFSPDGRTMYFSDTPTGEIRACDYNPATGTPGDWRVFARIDPAEGRPDGSCVDVEGGLWNARWDGGRVVRHLPDGRSDMVVRLPVPHVTCCVIGGTSLRTLFITTASPDPGDGRAGAGGVYAVDLPVRGLPAEIYTR
jgi:L-arabinonolactonase